MLKSCFVGLLCFTFAIEVTPQLSSSHSLSAGSTANNTESSSDIQSSASIDSASLDANSTSSGDGTGTVVLNANTAANITNGTNTSEGVAGGSIDGAGDNVNAESGANFGIGFNNAAKTRLLKIKNLATGLGGATNLRALLAGRLAGEPGIANLSAAGENTAFSEGDQLSLSDIVANVEANNDTIHGDLQSTGQASGSATAQAQAGSNLTLEDGTGSHNMVGGGEILGVQGGTSGSAEVSVSGTAAGGPDAHNASGLLDAIVGSDDSGEGIILGEASALVGDKNGTISKVAENAGVGPGSSHLETTGQVNANKENVTLDSNLLGNITGSELGQSALIEGIVNDASGQSGILGVHSLGGSGTENTTGNFSINSAYHAPNNATLDIENAGEIKALGTGIDGNLNFTADGILDHNGTDTSVGAIIANITGTADELTLAGNSSMGFKSGQQLKGKAHVGSIAKGKLRSLLNSRLSGILDRLSTSTLTGESNVTVEATGEDTEAASNTGYDSENKNTALLVNDHSGVAKGANNSQVSIVGTSVAGETGP